MNSIEYTITLTDEEARVLADILDIVITGDGRELDQDDMTKVEDIECKLGEAVVEDDE
jgi:K+/H+ antiporter YhaU regulatory subunit KhtT